MCVRMHVYTRIHSEKIECYMSGTGIIKSECVEEEMRACVRMNMQDETHIRGDKLMGFKFFCRNVFAYTYLQITVRMRDYIHIA